MNSFGLYSDYYDLLYAEKDYDHEVQYVDGLIRQYLPNAASILDLGCGTGLHAVALASQGYSVI